MESQRINADIPTDLYIAFKKKLLDDGQKEIREFLVEAIQKYTKKSK